MPKTKAVESELEQSVSQSALVDALKEVVDAVKPTQYKTIANRTKNTPWTPKNGPPKPKLKRKFYQHGLLIGEARLTGNQISLINQLRPGTYCGGHIKVTRRRDRGIDISWPIKTPSQRLYVLSQLGLRTLDEIFERCIEEAKNPKRDMLGDDE